MHIKSILSVAALTAALGLTGPATAQMLAGQQLTEGDIARIQNYCNDLEREQDSAVELSPETDADDDEDTNIPGVQEDLITYAWCLETGFVERIGD
ncbi:MAG TPA: hypothetical protein VGN60_05410 [Devosia sp.]|jgi:broad specificity phosphatase PhoE|nr:hypothetical protein [Devosia sp.]